MATMAQLSVRFYDKEEEKRVHELLKKTAKANNRTLNGEIVHALQYYLKHSPETKVIRTNDG